jgi:6-pyruvoyltetrahydropterin/6-carboxytetrahydropterin synthase
MPVLRLVRRYHFSAAHRLHSPLLTDEVNRDTYGKCNNPFGHGHNYVLEVAVRGNLHPVTGQLLPHAQFDGFVRETVLRDFATRNLNVEVPEFLTLVPTTENVAAVIARRLALAWPLHFPGLDARFEKVRIWETRNNIFEEFAPLTDGDSSSHPHAAFASVSQAGRKVTSK